MIRLLIVLFGAFSIAAPPALAQSVDLSGVWRGVLEVGGAELRLELHIEGADDDLSGYMISVDQGDARVPVASITWDGETLTADMPAARARYEATLASTDQLAGVFTQGRSFPLRLERNGEAFVPVQTPVVEIPDVEQVGRDIEVTLQSGDIELAGALRLPAGEGPFPAFVMLTGTGPQDRDETVADRPIFAAFASELARRGIASLRLDDRGVGGSGGDFAQATSYDYAHDADAALEWLKARSDILSDRVGFFGHSEGAVTAFLAAEDSAPAFIMTLAGMTSKAEPLLHAQTERIMRLSGEDDAAIAEYRTMQDAIIRAANEADEEDLPEAIEQAVLSAGGDQEQAQLSRATWGTPWFKTLLTIDTPALMAAYDGPVTAIYAELDTQVVVESQVPIAQAALAENRAAIIETLAGKNHLFQDAATGLPAEYAQIPQVVSPGALEAIGAAATRLVYERNR